MLSPRYRLPLLHHTERPFPPISAQRVFHCLHYLTKYRHPVDMHFDVVPERRFLYRAPVVDFREFVGPRNTNDTRAIRAAVTELGNNPRLAAIVLSSDRRSLNWAFAHELDELLSAEPYLSLDIGIVASLGTSLEVYLYEVCRRLDRMQYPEQALMVADLCRIHGRVR